MSRFEPTPNLNGSEWAEEYRQLSGETGPGGKWHNSNVPIMVDFMNAMTDIDVREVTFMKPSRISGTECVSNFLGRMMHIEPGPSQMVQPSTGKGKQWSKTIFDAMVRDTPILRNRIYDFGEELIPGARRREKGNEILFKTGPGWILYITGANTPNAFSQTTIKNMILDELDRYKSSVGSEGSPVALARERAKGSFSDYKLIKLSSPTVQDASLIEEEYLLGNRMHYAVPCPNCGELRVILFSNQSYFKRTDYGSDLPAMYVTFDRSTFNPDSPESVWLVCEKCGGIMPELLKHRQIPLGKWIAEKPGMAYHKSFHANQFYSLFPQHNWSGIVKEFLDAGYNREKLQVFANTKLAEPFMRQEAINVRPGGMLVLTEDFPKVSKDDIYVPIWASAIFAAIDRQDDRFEVQIIGAGPDDETGVLAYKIIDGSPSQKRSWLDLWKYLDGLTFTHALGVRLRIAVEVYDTGGHFSIESYKYIRMRRQAGHHAFGIKGRDQDKFVSGPTWKNKEHIPLYSIGVDNGKNTLMARVNVMLRSRQEDEPRAPGGPAWMHFPSHICDEEYFDKFMSENKIRIADKYGIYKSKWVPKKSGMRNEPWDLWVYGLAAIAIWNGNLRREAAKIRRRARKLHPDQAPAPREKNVPQAAATETKPKHKRRLGRRPAKNIFGD